MGKVIINEDKRTIWYLSVCTVFTAANTYPYASVIGDALNRQGIGIGNVAVFCAMGAAIGAVYLIVLSRMILIAKFDGVGIRYGFLLKREIKYADICGVDTKEGLEIHLKAETRRIRVIDLSRNEEKYAVVLESVYDNTSIDAQPQNHINRLKKTAYIPEQRKWLRDMLLFIFICLLLAALDDALFIMLMTSFDFVQMICPAKLILHSLALLYGLTATVFMAGKHKKAPFFIKTYFWVHFAVALVSYMIAYFMPAAGGQGTTGITQYIIIRTAMLVFLALFASRYAAKSETAQSVLSDDMLFSKYQTDSKNHLYKKKSKGLIIFALVCLAFGALMTYAASCNIPYYCRLDKARYSSPESVIEQKYKGAQGGYLSAGNYHLIYAEDTEKGFIDENVYYETDDGDILALNDWHEETYDNLSKSGYFNYETGEFPDRIYLFGHIYVSVHDKYFIISAHVRDSYESYEDIEVYGNSQEFYKAKISETSEFLKVIALEEGTPDYRITVTADGKEIYSATLKDIIED